MQFLNEEKFARGVSHAEYEQYWKAHRDSFSIDLLRINGGMLPGHLYDETTTPIHLHDSQIMNGQHDSRTETLRLHLHGDHDGGLRHIFMTYDGVTHFSGISPSMLGTLGENDDGFRHSFMVDEGVTDFRGIHPAMRADRGESDIMCHEVILDTAGLFHHVILFASGEVLSLQFSQFTVEIEDEL
jgi:hypothetical protein